MYSLNYQQFLPIDIKTCWEFFSDPENLEKITPPDMKFIITSKLQKPMFAGHIISYKIKIFPFLYIKWVTEITHVVVNNYFVDEQRFGPYRFWHHLHKFKEINGGIEMADNLNYKPPFGILGRLANFLFIRKKIDAIFNYRKEVLEEIFMVKQTN